MKFKIRGLIYIALISLMLFTGCSKRCKHKETVWIIDREPSCTVAGSKHEECTKCKEIISKKSIAVTEHTYVDGKCSVCGYESKLTYELDSDGKSYIVSGLSDFLVSKELVIPKEYNGLPITKIKDYAFANKDIPSIVIPSNIIEIGKRAFMDAGIDNIYIENGLKVIGELAFLAVVLKVLKFLVV